jgi:hypothetical protein
VPFSIGLASTIRHISVYLFDLLHVNAVDLGYVVDLGVYRAPDQPHNPDQPRYFRDAPDHASRMYQHAPASLRGHSPGSAVAAREEQAAASVF